jgi:hypothetical protein
MRRAGQAGYENIRRRSGAYIAGRKRGKEAIIYFKTKDILSRTKLSKLAHRKRSGDAGGDIDGDGELTVLDIDHIIAS